MGLKFLGAFERHCLCLASAERLIELPWTAVHNAVAQAYAVLLDPRLHHRVADVLLPCFMKLSKGAVKKSESVRRLDVLKFALQTCNHRIKLFFPLHPGRHHDSTPH